MNLKAACADTLEQLSEDSEAKAIKQQLLELIEQKKLTEAEMFLEASVKANTQSLKRLRIIRCQILALQLRFADAQTCLHFFDDYAASGASRDQQRTYNGILSTIQLSQDVVVAASRQEHRKVIQLTERANLKILWPLIPYRVQAEEQLSKSKVIRNPWWTRKEILLPIASGALVAVGIGLTLGLTPRRFQSILWDQQ